MVWLIPGLQQPKCWKSPFGYHHELAIPAETLNRIDVFHIGTNGYIVGCDWQSRFVEPSHRFPPLGLAQRREFRHRNA